MSGFWYSVEPQDILPADALSAADDVCHFRVQKAHEDSCVKLTKGMRFIWMVTPELAEENPKVGKVILAAPSLAVFGVQADYLHPKQVVAVLGEEKASAL